MGKAEKRACKACILNEGDNSLKMCEYCSVCGEWLCSRCRNNPWSRLKAVAKKKGMTIDNYMKKLAREA